MARLTHSSVATRALCGDERGPEAMVRGQQRAREPFPAEEFERGRGPSSGESLGMMTRPG